MADAFGIDFCPRIKAIFKQQLYHPPGMKVPGPLKKHFARAVDVELIKKYWDDYVRMGALLLSLVSGSEFRLSHCLAPAANSDAVEISRAGLLYSGPEAYLSNVFASAFLVLWASPPLNQFLVDAIDHRSSV